jgi:hypothetical protein
MSSTFARVVHTTANEVKVAELLALDQIGDPLVLFECHRHALHLPL